MASGLTRASRGSGSGFLDASSGRESGRTLAPRRARRRSPAGAEFREVFKDGFIRGIKVIFSALISSPALISKYHLAHSCAVSTFYLKKINTSFFPPPPAPPPPLARSDRGTFIRRALPGVLSIFWNVKNLKAWIKGTFLINIFFP